MIRSSLATVLAAGLALLSLGASPGWSTLPSPPAKYPYPFAVPLADDTVLVAGGVSGPGGAAIYDGTKPAWTLVPGPSMARFEPAAERLADGRVLFVGGAADATSAEVFDPATKKWTGAPALSRERYRPAVVRLADGRVLVAGGTVSATRAADLYDAKASTVVPLQLPVDAVRTALAPLLDGGALLAVASGATVPGSVHRLDPKTLTWSDVAPPPVKVGEYPLLVALLDGTVLFTSGPPHVGGDVVSRYDPAKNTWSSVGRLQTARRSVSTARLRTGEVVFVGGYGTGVAPLRQAEVYDPKTESIRALPDPPLQLVSQTVAPLPNATALVVATEGVLQLMPPRRCSNEEECGGGRCVDGFCCDSSCVGNCEACDLPKLEGVCSAVIGAPRGTRPACSPPWTTPCKRKACDGIDRASCQPVSSGACACVADDDCPSGFCVDGVCCDSRCDGICEACDVEGARGACKPVKGEPHGTRPSCGPSGELVCEKVGCNGRDRKTCGFTPGQETYCGAMCGVSMRCNGAGKCVADAERCPSCATPPMPASSLFEAGVIASVLATWSLARRRRRRRSTG